MTIMWREQLRVGNDIIDEDHKYLIDIINQIGVHLQNNEMSALELDLQRLYDYSLLHFSREEKIAVAVGFELAFGLHHSHQTLMERLATIRTAFVESEKTWTPQLALELSEFLRNWLIDHVLHEDMLMKPALQKYPPDFSPG